MSDATYNGWKNYETWATALWIDNEESTYYEVHGMVAEKLSDFDGDAKAALYKTATMIKDYVEENMIPELPASLASDLLGAALSEVDWREIAENYLGDAG